MKNLICFSFFLSSAKPNRLIFENLENPQMPEAKSAELPIKMQEVKKEGKIKRKDMMDAVMGKVEGQEELEIVATDLETLAKFVHERFGISYSLYTSQDGNLVLEFQGHKAEYDPINNTLIANIDGLDFQLIKRDKNNFELSMNKDGEGMLFLYSITGRSVSIYKVNGTEKELLTKNYSLKGKNSSQRLIALLQTTGL